MKYRAGFVSNSSSSSFVIIGEKLIDKDHMRNYYTDGIWNSYEYGETEFGWTPEDYMNVHDRVNFAFLQALSVKNDEWLEMIERVIKEYTGANIVDHGFIFKSYDYNGSEIRYVDNGYIDHASCATEGENTEIFKDEDTLRRFLFADDSYIHTDNDNY